MKVRYLLGLIHKSVEQLEELIDEKTKQTRLSNSLHINNRMMNISKALKKKYNM
jgi:hypothetical protein